MAAKNFATSLEIVENEATVDVFGYGYYAFSRGALGVWLLNWYASYGVGSALLVLLFRAMRRPLAAGRAQVRILRFLFINPSSRGSEEIIADNTMSEGLTYNVDIVMCIDCTGSMGALLETVKARALKFHSDLKESCAAKQKNISELRIRVIGFRDLGHDGPNAIIDSGFLSIPEELEKFESIINSFSPQGGGPEPESGLEALSMAINSDWTKGGDRRRHVIVVWSDASTHDLGEIGKDNPLYPAEAPKDFDELTDWWDDEEGGRMNKSAKRLIIFAPDAKWWTAMGNNWNNAIHHPAKAGEGLEEVDYKTILSTIVYSI